MARIRVRITNKGESYTKEVLLEAVESVRSGRLTIAKAVRMYNIPWNTINNHMKRSKSFGKPPALYLDTELRVTDNLRIMENIVMAYLVTKSWSL